MKVYILWNGCEYSDRSVRGITSTREGAAKLALLYDKFGYSDRAFDPEADVEEFELDPQDRIPPGHRVWRVSFKPWFREGVDTCALEDGTLEDQLWENFDARAVAGGNCVFFVTAVDEDSARARAVTVFSAWCKKGDKRRTAPCRRG